MQHQSALGSLLGLYGLLGLWCLLSRTPCTYSSVIFAQEEPSWPLDYHLPFNLLGIMAVFAAAWSLFLPKSIESKYEEPAILKSLDEEEGQEPEAYPASPL